MEWRVTETDGTTALQVHLNNEWVHVTTVRAIRAAESGVKPFKRTITVAEGNPEFAVLQGLRGMIQNNIPD